MTNFLGVPDVVWSGVIASIIAFVGVALSNRSNTDRLERQLKHDAFERASQRRSELRKGVYLRFAEEFTNVNAFIGRMSEIDATEQNLSEGLREFHACAAQVQLVCNFSTSEAISKLASTQAKLWVTAIARAKPIYDIKSEIKAKSDVYDAAQSEIKRILSEMALFNEAARTDRQVFEALNRSFDAQRKIADSISEHRQMLWSKMTSLQAGYLKFITDEMRHVLLASAPVVAAMRRELEIDGYNVGFEKLMVVRIEEMQKEMAEVATKFLNEIGVSQIEEKMEAPQAG